MTLGAELSSREYTGVRVEHDGAVLTVTLDRPDRLNALNAAVLDSLAAVAERAGADDVRVVILTGAGRGFCAGADLRESGPEAHSDGSDMLRTHYNPAVEALAGIQKPVIAAINGPAAGAGIALACVADIRIAASTARFVPAFARAGLVPDAGATFFLPRILGYARAVEWMFSGEQLDADAALSWGLVSAVVPTEELAAHVLLRAQELAAHPRTAVSLTKALLGRSGERSLAEQLEAEAQAQEVALRSGERQAARARVVAGLRAQNDPGAPSRVSEQRR